MGKDVVVWPYLGSSGTHGLVNAVWTLIGFAMQCRQRNATLVLPRFLKYAAHLNIKDSSLRQPMPFDQIFQPQPFITSLEARNLQVT